MKYMGKIYEGRWKVVSMKKSENGNIDGYYLENVYNQQRIYVNKSTLARIEKGETSVSKFIKRVVSKVKRNLDCWGHKRKGIDNESSN